jgi:hypothetical protein
MMHPDDLLDRDNPPLEKLKRALRESMARGVEVGIGAIGLGLFTADGRQVAVRVKAAGAMLDISDGGETWSDLWMDGLVAADPSDAMREKLIAACKTYGVFWDQRARSIACPADAAKFPDVAKRIAAASLAIDGWRSWLSLTLAGEATELDRARGLEQGVREVAERRDWIFEAHPSIPGHRFQVWKANAILRRGGRQAALALLLHEPSQNAVKERARGWILDTTTRLIFVTNENVANDLVDAAEFAGRAIMVQRQRHGTPEKIMEAVERIAAPPAEKAAA